MCRITIKLPWPISVNRLYKNIKAKKGHHGNKALTTEGKNYIDFAIIEIIKQLKNKKVKHIPGVIECWKIFQPRDNRTKDITNLEKILNDILEKAGLIDNDFKIWKYHGERIIPKKPGDVEITIQPLDSD